jgi:hypothetical protein
MEFRTQWQGVEQLINDTAKLAKLSGEKSSELRAINKKAASYGLTPYKSAIQRGKIVRVRRSGPSSSRYEGGKRGPSQDIMPGTLKRSIKVIQPASGTNVWLGPKSTATFKKKGLKQINRSDAWFADIVNQGRERYGAGRNRNFATKGIQRAQRAILPQLKRMHKTFLLKHF